MNNLELMKKHQFKINPSCSVNGTTTTMDFLKPPKSVGSQYKLRGNTVALKRHWYTIIIYISLKSIFNNPNLKPWTPGNQTRAGKGPNGLNNSRQSTKQNRQAVRQTKCIWM